MSNSTGSEVGTGFGPESISIDNTFGAGLIGAFITAMLYGLTTLQTFNYFIIYPKDDRGVKTLVWVVWILDTLHVALSCFCMYYYLVTNYMNPSGLADSHWSLNITVLLNLLLAVVVQSFFSRQVFILCRGLMRLFLTIVLSISVLAHFVFGIVTVAFLFIYPNFIEFQESQLVRLAGAAPFAIFAVLSDVFIAGSLCYLLYENRTGFRDTNTIITTLIVYAVNRCLLTSFVAITEVIVFVSTPRTLWFLAIDFVIGKLYANSLLASLNSRKSLRSTPRGTSVSTNFSIATPDGINFSNSSGTNADRQRGRVVALDSFNDVELADRRDRSLDGFMDTSTKRSHQTTGQRVHIATSESREREDYEI